MLPVPLPHKEAVGPGTDLLHHAEHWVGSHATGVTMSLERLVEILKLDLLSVNLVEILGGVSHDLRHRLPLHSRLG